MPYILIHKTTYCTNLSFIKRKIINLPAHPANTLKEFLLLCEFNIKMYFLIIVYQIFILGDNMTGVDFDENERRLDEACALIKSGNDDATARKILGLYSERRDGEDPHWLNYMGIAYQMTGTSVFDERKSHDFFLKSANLGNGAAAYNLGVRWLHGHYDQIDTERARFWFQRAFELGHGCGGASYSSILMDDPRYGSSHYVDFTENVHKILEASERQGGPWALFETATLYASRRLSRVGPDGTMFDEADFDGALERYQTLASEEICAPPRGRAALCLALHAFLGHIRPIDLQFALKYIDRMPSPSQQETVLYGISNTADRLRHIINTELIPYDMEQRRKGTNAFTLRPDHQAAYTLMDDLWTGKIKQSDVIKRIHSGEIAVTQALKDRLWAQDALNQQERNKYTTEWNEIFLAAQLKSLHLSEPQLIAQTREFGPEYNDYGSNGFPIPGVRRPINYQKSAHPTWDIQAGFGKLVGLRATQGGDVAFSFETQSAGQAPLIFPEDIDVVLALAFSGNKMHWPSVSIDDFEPRVASRPRWAFFWKKWDPYWIGETLIGKTLYGTDYWIGKLAWESKDFPIGGVNRDQTRSLLNKLALCGGRRDGMSARVMLRPSTVHWNWTRDHAQTLECRLHKIDMRVDGGNIIVYPDGTEDHSRHLNSPDYATGRVANLLTENYDQIAELWPMFERLRQINGLLYSASALRDFGFQPNVSLRERIKDTYIRYNSYKSGEPPEMNFFDRLTL